jgi:hypothetical protein
MVATTANVKTATDVNESMVVRTPYQNLTVPSLTITVEHHATASYTTNCQSLPSLLPQDRLTQTVVFKGNGYGNVFNLAKTTFIAFYKATCYAFRLSNRPTAIKAYRTRRLMAPHMLMANDHLIGAIHVSNGDPLVSFNVLADQMADPSTAKFRALHATTYRHVVFMFLIVNRQVPIFIFQDSMVETQTLRKRTSHSFN